MVATRDSSDRLRDDRLVDAVHDEDLFVDGLLGSADDDPADEGAGDHDHDYRDGDHRDGDHGDDEPVLRAVFAPDDDGPPLPDGRRPLTNLSGARVLILNASFEPLHVCSLKRAVALLMQEIAERVEDGDRVLRSPTAVFPVPSVIRLRRFVKRPPRQRVAFNRKNLFRRDDHTCQYCRVRSNDLTLDHVVPRSRGGPTSWENVVACCRRCNAQKRDRTPDEARMALTRRPTAPAFLFSSAYGLLPDIDPVWEKYLPQRR